MKKKLTSSAIIPFYNAGEFIDETLKSIRGQTRKFDEIIIVNDGSSDELSVEKLKELKKAKDLKIINQKNQGVVKALTNGMKIATSDIVFEQDADDIILPNYVEKFMEVFESDLSVDGVTCGYKSFFDGVDYLEEKNFHKLYMPTGYIQPNMFFYNCLGGQNSAFRREKVESVNYYLDFEGPQDWGIWLKFVKKKYKQIILNEYLYLYRVHKKGFSQRIEKDHDFDEALRKIMGEINHDDCEKYSKEKYLELKKQFFDNRKEDIIKNNKKTKPSLKKIKQLSVEAIYGAKREGIKPTLSRIKNYIKHGKGIL